jgi:molecular chaperone DnaK (HSP70)
MCLITKNKYTVYVDAEQYQKDTEIERNRLFAKNSFEQYCFNLKITIDEEKLGEKIDAYDKKKIIDTIEDTLKWIETNQVRKISFSSFNFIRFLVR